MAAGADLLLQIDLLPKYEVIRRLCLVSAIARELDMHETEDHELRGLLKTVRPRDLLREVESWEGAGANNTQRRPPAPVKTGDQGQAVSYQLLASAFTVSLRPVRASSVATSSAILAFRSL